MVRCKHRSALCWLACAAYLASSTTCMAGQQQIELLIKTQQEPNNSTIKSSDSLNVLLANQYQQPQHRLHQHTNKQTSLSSSILETFIRINDMRAYHLDLHSYRPEAKYSGDPDYVDSENPLHLDRCMDHLSQYQHLLKSFTEIHPIVDKTSPESLRLADSFGRPEAGTLLGSQFWIGSYSGCLNFVHRPDHDRQQPIKSQYCLGIVQYPNWNPQDSRTSIKVGLCMPETCTNSMLNDNKQLFHQVETMMKYQFGNSRPYGMLKLRQVYCLPHETSVARQYSTSALVFLALAGLFVATCLIATFLDHFTAKLLVNHKLATESSSGSSSESLSRSPSSMVSKEPKKSRRQIIIEAFSLSRNLNKLLYVRPSSKANIQVASDSRSLSVSSDEGEPIPKDFDRETFLNSLAGIKCIGLFWIICAHTFLVGPIPSNNVASIDALTKTYLADIYLTAHLVVDTFFAFSGLLASYLIFSNGIQAVKTKHWIVLTIHRYWRLTPIYLLNYWFTKSVGSQINTGPMWDYGTSEVSPRLNCARESWFEAILHMSDFKSPKEHCVPFAWFIANGIKFWMVTPIFLILIHKSLRLGYTITIGTIIANIALVANLALESNVDLKSVIEFKPESANNMLNNMGQIYTRPYSRIGAYLIGLLAGHLLYLVDTKKLEVKLSKHANIIIWTLFSVTVTVLTFLLKIAGSMPIEELALPYVFAFSSALIRPLWAICSCWIIFAMSIGQIKWVARFLSANVWQILVKLTFCAYLAQGEVIAQLFLSTQATGPYTYTDMTSLAIVTIFWTLVVSSALVLFFEYPLHGIEQLILPSKRIRASTEEATPVDARASIDDKDNHREKLSLKTFSFSSLENTKFKAS